MATSHLSLCAVALCAAPVAAGTAPQFTPLGFLNDTGFRWSQVNGISEDGMTVVGLSSRVDDNSPSCFRWTPGGSLVGLPDLNTGPNSAEVYGVSADGARAVGTGTVFLTSSNEVVNRPIRWTGATPGSLPPAPNGRTAAGFGISGDGLVVVGHTSTFPGGNADRAVRWVGSTPQMFTYTSGPFAGNTVGGRATATNWDGSVVTGQEFNGSTAWVWRQGIGATTLQLTPAYTFGSITDVSNDGNSLLLSLRPDSGLGWTIGIMNGGLITEMPRLPGSQGMDPTSMSADCATVAGVASTPFGERAVLVRADGAYLLKSVLEGAGLDLTGWTLSSCVVSGDGLHFAGRGFDPQGRTQAWYATIPTPGGLVFLGFGAMLAVRRRR